MAHRGGPPRGRDGGGRKEEAIGGVHWAIGGVHWAHEHGDENGCEHQYKSGRPRGAQQLRLGARWRPTLQAAWMAPDFELPMLDVMNYEVGA